MNGILIIDKPEGWTSHDVVGRLRRILGQRRIGHGGTLDPMATGVLPVFVGRATRAVQFIEGADKTYVAGLRLGVETDTQDITGQVLRQTADLPDRAAVEAVLDQFRGEIWQLPPMYSAIKVGGRKLYELARKGQAVERQPRKITIYSLKLQKGAGADYTLAVLCSKGTYIRTLCSDIGAALGCGGTMSALRRTQVGAFDLEAACSLAEVEEKMAAGTLELTPVDWVFRDRPAVTIDAAAAEKCRHGAAFPWAAGDGEYRVYGPAGEFLMLGRMEDGEMATVKSFFEV